MYQKKLILPALAALLLTTSLAHAEDTGAAAAKADIAASAASAKDGVKNGKRGEHQRKMFETMDGNKDGVIDQAEAEQFTADRFNRIDADKDGRVTADEMANFHKGQREAWAAGRAQAEGKGPTAGKGDKAKADSGNSESRGQKFFARLDKNGDGAIDRSEFAAPALARHQKMDSDGDGKVSADEMKKAHEAMRGEKKAKMKESRAKKDGNGVNGTDAAPASAE